MATTPQAPVPTPQTPPRNVPGAPDATAPASLAKLPARQPTHANQGPANMPVTGKPIAVRSGPPPLHAPPAAMAKPKEQK